MAQKLTQTSIAQLTPRTDKKRYLVFDSVVLGLYVSVLPTGRKTFNVQYQIIDKVSKHKTRSCKKIGDASVLSIAQARDRAKEILAGVTFGENPNEKPEEDITQHVKTLSQLIDLYKNLWAGESRSRNEVIAMFKHEFASYLNNSPLELKVIDIEKWQQSKRNGSKKIKFITINKYTFALIAMLNWATTRDLIPFNPLKMKKLKETDSLEKTRYLSNNERLRLMGALDRRENELREARRKTRLHSAKKYLPDLENTTYVDAFKPMITLALNTGIRRNALFSLLWEDIDFDSQTILLRAASAKSQKTIIIPMNKLALDTLLAWKAQTKEPTGLVFPNPETGRKFEDCKKTWSSILAKAKIENFRWHDMRHDFASRLVMAGIDLNTVRELLGHSDIKMTLRYAHLAPEKKKAAVELLN